MDNALLLIVEDDQLQQVTLEESLEEAGFGVMTASNANQAFAALDRDIGSLKGLITDIGIASPQSGWDVARYARGKYPSIAVVYISGDSSHEWASQGVPNSLLLTKPYGMAQLVTAISQLMTCASQIDFLS